MTSNESTNFTRRFSLVNHAGFAILLVLIGSMWAFHFPLSNDGPAHLYNTPIARALLFEPNSQLKNLYSLHWPVPNWTMTLVLVALETVVSPLTAAKLAVSLILLGSYFANRTFLIGAAGSERKSAAGILSLFFANTWFVWMGFWNFSLGTAFALFAASYARTRWLRWRGVHTLVLLAAMVIVIATHLIPAVFLSFLLVLMLFEDAEGRLRFALPRRRLGVAVVAFLPIAVTFGLRFLDAGNYRHVLNTHPRDLLQAVLFYPVEAFEVLRIPYADGKYAIAAIAVAVLIVFYNKGMLGLWRSPLLTGGVALLLASIVLNDTQSSGAFLQPRLAAYSFFLLAAWALQKADARFASVVTAVIAVSCCVTVLAMISVFRDADAYAREARGAIEDAGIKPGSSFITLQYPAPATERMYGLNRLRMPYLLVRELDWPAMEQGLIDLTCYEDLSRNFPIQLRITNRALIGPLSSLPEPDINSTHARDMITVLRGLSVDYVIIVGEFGADWSPEGASPGLFQLLEKQGYSEIARRGSPVFIRIFAGPQRRLAIYNTGS